MLQFSPFNLTWLFQILHFGWMVWGCFTWFCHGIIAPPCKMWESQEEWGAALIQIKLSLTSSNEDKTLYQCHCGIPLTLWASWTLGLSLGHSIGGIFSRHYPPQGSWPQHASWFPLCPTLPHLPVTFQIRSHFKCAWHILWTWQQDAVWN